MSRKRETALRKKILIVDDDQDFRWAVRNVLTAAGYKMIEAEDGGKGLELLEKDAPDLILLDFRMPKRDGLNIAADMIKRAPAVPVIMITGYGGVKGAVSAMRIGVYDYVTKPIDNNDLLFTIQRALERQDLAQELNYLKKTFRDKQMSLYEVMGQSNEIKNLVLLLEKVAPTTFTVLIEGESGTGKELVAKALHSLSKVNKGPFVPVDCGAIPETLIESELFGYMKGAFTDAYADKPGQFELADGGTLFLDEVGNLPYTAQRKLLRAMQERVVQRLGAKKAHPIQVRIVAATNQPLEKDIKSGNFRSDLYFRLKEFVIKVPSIRERKDDIPYLARRFKDEVQWELGKTCDNFSGDAINALLSYEWPGNVRELRNVIRQSVLLCEENTPITPTDLMFSAHNMSATTVGHTALISNYGEKRPLKEVLKSFTDALEKKLIKEIMLETKENKSEAARRLGIDYKTLLRKIKIHRIC